LCIVSGFGVDSFVILSLNHHTRHELHAVFDTIETQYQERFLYKLSLPKANYPISHFCHQQ
jgi:hypothetical protein